MIKVMLNSVKMISLGLSFMTLLSLSFTAVACQCNSGAHCVERNDITQECVRCSDGCMSSQSSSGTKCDYCPNS